MGDSAVFLKEGVKFFIKTFEGTAIAIELPQKVTLEITETEPVVKGQTASSSYKPAICENGLRVMGPPAHRRRHQDHHQHRRPQLRLPRLRRRDTGMQGRGFPALSRFPRPVRVLLLRADLGLGLLPSLFSST